ncbi:MAG: SGNH/GDSL hydrolase family protein [Alphaproteobacteria bacterium]|nr:SGNH/GDSL hydrolase family protein [Alphaproteobacteria bacterium]
MITLLLAALAIAAEPIVAAGNGLVAAPPEGFVKPDDAVVGTWVSVLGDCLEEARPGEWSVVDRSRDGTTTVQLATEAAAIRELGPRTVVLGVGAHEMGPDETVDAFAKRLAGVVGALRADNGPSVLLVGIVPPTLSQLEWKDGEDVQARQAAVDARTAEWNAALGKIAEADDGVWVVDLGWPSERNARQRLTRGGWALTDRAHARIGAVICEEILKNLKNVQK